MRADNIDSVTRYVPVRFISRRDESFISWQWERNCIGIETIIRYSRINRLTVLSERLTRRCGRRVVLELKRSRDVGEKVFELCGINFFFFFLFFLFFFFCCSLGCTRSC